MNNLKDVTIVNGHHEVKIALGVGYKCMDINNNIITSKSSLIIPVAGISLGFVYSDISARGYSIQSGVLILVLFRRNDRSPLSKYLQDFNSNNIIPESINYKVYG